MHVAAAPPAILPLGGRPGPPPPFLAGGWRHARPHAVAAPPATWLVAGACSVRFRALQHRPR
eukprot:10002382-Alexandrium_andersonii.AAC.1